MKPLICIIAPSGVGKTTFVNELEKRGFKSVQSYTTRPKRTENEKGHTFVDKETFSKLDLVAYTEYNGYEYGATFEQVDQSDLFIIDIDGLIELKKLYQKRNIIVIGLDRKGYLKQLEKRDGNLDRFEYDKKAFLDFKTHCDFILELSSDVEKDITLFFQMIHK